MGVAAARLFRDASLQDLREAASHCHSFLEAHRDPNDTELEELRNLLAERFEISTRSRCYFPWYCGATTSSTRVQAAEAQLARANDKIPFHPPGMAIGESVTPLMKERQRRKPSQWSMSVEQYLASVNHCIASPLYEKVKRAKKRVTMYDINDLFVKPWSKGTGCSLAVLMSQTVDKHAQLMLSHAWGEDTDELLEALHEHITSKDVPLWAMIWFCVFSNYQPEDGYGPSIKETIALDPFGDVIRNNCLQKDAGGYGMVAIHTTAADLYSRLWCVYEVFFARIKVKGVEVSGAMSKLYFQHTMDRVTLFSAKGFNLVQCLNAADVRVNSIKAQCGFAGDEEMLVDMIKEEAGGFEALDEVISNFRKDALPASFFEAFATEPNFIQTCNSAARKCPDMMKVALASDGTHLAHLDEDMKKNPDVVKVAVAQNWKALEYAHKDLKKDRDVVMAAVANNGFALGDAHEDLKKDRDVVMAAVANNGNALRCAHEDMKKNPDVVKVAVAQNWEALYFAHKDLQKDSYFMNLVAVCRFGFSALKDLPEDLKKDRDIVMAAVTKNGGLLEYAHEDLKKDRDVVMAAVTNKGFALKYADEDLKKDRDFMMALMTINGDLLEYAHEDLKKDRDVVMAAVTNEGYAFTYAHEDLKNDPELRQLASQN